MKDREPTVYREVVPATGEIMVAVDFVKNGQLFAGSKRFSSNTSESILQEHSDKVLADARAQFSKA